MSVKALQKCTSKAPGESVAPSTMMEQDSKRERRFVPKRPTRTSGTYNKTAASMPKAVDRLDHPRSGTGGVSPSSLGSALKEKPKDIAQGKDSLPKVGKKPAGKESKSHVGVLLGMITYA